MAKANFRIEYEHEHITIWLHDHIIYEGWSWEDVKEEIEEIMKYLDGVNKMQKAKFPKSKIKKNKLTTSRIVSNVNLNPREQ